MDKNKYLLIKVLAVAVACLGILGFGSADGKGGWITIPVTIAVGALIFALAILTEIIVKNINSIKAKGNKPTANDNDESNDQR